MAKRQQKKPKRKTPVIPESISTTKIPRYLGLPNIEDSHLAWRFSRADLSGPYTCGDFSHSDFRQLWERLRAFEKMNVAEMRSAGSFHPKPVIEMEREDRERLREIQLDDVEELYSFVIDGPCRMWCIKYENILLVLWWDRHHRVSRVAKSHT